MLRYVYPLTLLIVCIIWLSSCHNQTKNSEVIKATSRLEDERKFLDSFYTDCLFQNAHITFPLKCEIYFDKYHSDTKSFDELYCKDTTYQRKDYYCIKLQLHKNNYVCDGIYDNGTSYIDGHAHIYKKTLVDGDEFIHGVSNIFEHYSFNSIFVRKNGTWFLKERVVFQPISSPSTH